MSRYLEYYVDQGKPGVRHIARHPRDSLEALKALRRLPHLTAQLSGEPDGRVVAHGLAKRSLLGRTVLHAATAVLVLPEAPGGYSVGASKQTLRRKVRAAHKLGVHWRQVDSPEERRHLWEIANEQERIHPLEQYRQANPDNTDLLAIDLWLVAFSAADEPLLLSVTPVDGEWALLRYFRTFGSGDDQSNARYLMTEVLVEHLVSLGVRYLADEVSPVGLSNGIRHFQRMLGFRIFLVDLLKVSRSRAARPPTAPALQPVPNEPRPQDRAEAQSAAGRRSL